MAVPSSIRLVDSFVSVLVLKDIVVGMAASLSALVVFLVVQKLVLERHARAIDGAIDRYRQAISSDAWPSDVTVDLKRRVDRKALAMALNSGEVPVPLEHLRRAPWYGEAVRNLKESAMRGKWGMRVFALELLGKLGAVEQRPMVDEIVRHESHPQVYAAGLGCLAEFVDDSSWLRFLWDRLQDRPALSGSFNEWLFRTAIGALTGRRGAEVAVAAVRELLVNASLQDPLTLDLISAIGKAGLGQLVPELVARYAQERASKATRIACVRAVGLVRPDHSLLLRALRDRDWEVCAVGAKYLRGTTPEVIGALSACLTASAFYVRFNAAVTLATLGDSGREALERALVCPDRFARDISRYALHMSRPVYA
ncbi:heat repeat-containing PBS lyase [Burkholderiales bacterium GJ-E10]|nr:heat repeat-containing PBS lyase [Burkholderiales bacterium GJ-E10]